MTDLQRMYGGNALFAATNVVHEDIAEMHSLRISQYTLTIENAVYRTVFTVV